MLALSLLSKVGSGENLALTLSLLAVGARQLCMKLQRSLKSKESFFGYILIQALFFSKKHCKKLNSKKNANFWEGFFGRNDSGSLNFLSNDTHCISYKS